MKQLQIAIVLGAALALAACGGGNNSSNTSSNSGAMTNTGNKETSGKTVKQLNPLHQAHNAMTGNSIDINMGAMNGSNQDGSARVVSAGTGVQVTLKINNQPKGASEPAHIHEGTCKKLNPAPWKPLKNVVNGTSVTTVPGVTVAELKKEHYAINVHKSLTDLKTYVSCGDL